MAGYFLTMALGIPFSGALLQIFLPDHKKPFALFRWIAFFSSFLASVIAISCVAVMDRGVASVQLSEVISWVGSYSISYDVGLDGLNVPIILLISIVFPLLIIFEWNRDRGPKGIYGLLLILQACFFGVGFSQDLFLGFFFWTLSVFPLYFLLAIWGGAEREKAAFRFLITASIGNALFFLGLLLVYFSIEPHTFSFKELLGGRVTGTFVLFGSEYSLSLTAFFLIISGLVFRFPVWPIHGWLTFLATQAPASIFVLFTGILPAVGLYLLAKTSFSLFPVEFAGWSRLVLFFGALNVLFGAVISLAQRELRLLLAYLTLAHCGMILIGFASLDSAGVTGSMFQLLVVGLSLSGLGLFVGSVRLRKGHSAYLTPEGDPVFGGWIGTAPLLTFIAGLLMASVLGVPGLGGFVGQSLTVMGGYTVSPLAVIVLMVGLLIMTLSLFNVFRGVFLGSGRAQKQWVSDLSAREKLILFPIVGVLLMIGLVPKPFLDLMRPSVLTLLSIMK